MIEGIIFSDSSCSKVHKGLHISRSDVGGCERGTKEFEQHIAEIIWYRAKTKSAPKLDIKKIQGWRREGVLFWSFKCKTESSLGTDPPPSLAKKKKKKGAITKKIAESETDLSKKKPAEPKPGYIQHVTDTQKGIQPQGFK